MLPLDIIGVGEVAEGNEISFIHRCGKSTCTTPVPVPRRRTAQAAQERVAHCIKDKRYSLRIFFCYRACPHPPGQTLHTCTLAQLSSTSFLHCFAASSTMQPCWIGT
jgi:hypothetical protein